MFRPFCHMLLVVFLSFFLFFPGLPQEKTSIKKVVIDAGHGGKDPGAIGRKAEEKSITLGIALKLCELIRTNVKDVDVILTRDTDEFVELYQRAEIANRNKADLFISIHCNANPSRVFQGAETYVMGLHKSQQNLEISKLENASILMEPDYLTRYDGFDPNSDESYITLTLFQNAYLNQSTEFAAAVQTEMKDRVGMDDRGVRQAGFLVLYKTTMPGVLIEAGFLSNPVEESYLISNIGQEYIADAIYRAFLKYKQKLKKSKSQSIEAKSNHPPTTDEDSSLSETRKEVMNKHPDLPLPNGKEKIKTESSLKQTNNIWFCVQIATYPSDIGVKNPKFKGLSKVSVYQQGGMYKYIVGKETEVSKATQLLKEVNSKGFKDAFVVAFNGNERITLGQAKSLLNNQ
jgi:N-acetylmuramoyl-L-alanine amidase